MLAGCPNVSATYQKRESQALGQSYVALVEGRVTLPDPWTGEMRTASATSTLLEPEMLKGLFFVPLIYGFGEGQREFWAVSCDLTGRIVHLYIPSLDLVVFEVDENRAKEIDKGLRASLVTLRRRREMDPRVPAKRVAVIDMVWNYGHQMINHLSGLDLLVDLGLAGRVDEVWITGAQFFGPIDRLYPEHAGRLRLFPSREALGAALMREPSVAVRLGSNCFFQSTRRRLLDEIAKQPKAAPMPKRWPLIAVSVRTIDRRCVNLREVLAHIDRTLRPDFPDLGFVFDGWVFAQGETVGGSVEAILADPRYAVQMAREFEAVRDAASLLPPGAVLANLVGTSIFQSIATLMNVDAYFAHVGTLQHKIAFFSLTGGVIHGPRQQLSNIDSGTYQTELGVPPIYLDAAMVEDLPGANARGPSSSDYRITDLEACAARLRLALGENAGRVRAMAPQTNVSGI